MDVVVHDENGYIYGLLCLLFVYTIIALNINRTFVIGKPVKFPCRSVARNVLVATTSFVNVFVAATRT